MNALNTPKLTKAQRKTLSRYADTSDGKFLQGLPGASDLWRPLGLLDWRGSSFGCHFYSITEAGRTALAAHTRTQEAQPVNLAITCSEDRHNCAAAAEQNVAAA